jgi:hypothetical protein
MFRREAFDAIGGYSERFAAGEDQDFFFKMTSRGRVVTLPDVLYQFRYHLHNSTLLTGAQAVHSFADRYSRNGENLAALYMLGAMRLWAGQSPGILPEMIAKKSLSWNLQSLIALASASLGSLSPATLRFFLRSLIHVRDRLAGLRVKDGRPYEWRSK